MTTMMVFVAQPSPTQEADPMPTWAIVIHPDGTKVYRDEPPTLSWLQEQVGGYIEVLNLDTNDDPGLRGCMIINEEGKLSQPPLPPNPLAMGLQAEFGHQLQFGDYLAGPAVVVGPPDREGDSLPLPLPLADVVRHSTMAPAITGWG